MRGGTKEEREMHRDERWKEEEYLGRSGLFFLKKRVQEHLLVWRKNYFFFLWCLLWLLFWGRGNKGWNKSNDQGEGCATYM